MFCRFEYFQESDSQMKKVEELKKYIKPHFKKETVFNELKSLKEIKTGQTSVEVILLIGSILVITIISGTYVLDINSRINNQFNQTMDKARIFLLNRI